MSITVNDILKIDMFKDARILAGKNGLDREVERVNFTDCPIKFNDEEYALVGKGDLFICSLYMIKDDEDKLYDVFNFYIMTESSCCVLTDAYLTESKLPKKVLDLANQNRYPILMIPDEIQYGGIIRDLSEILLIDRSDMISENKLNRLLYDDLSSKDITSIAKYLNRHFTKYFVSCYFEVKKLDGHKWKMLIGTLKSNPHLQPLRYQNGAFVVINYSDKSSLQVYISFIRSTVEAYENDFFLGVSSEFIQVNMFDICIQQAHSSFEMSGITGDKIVFYDDLSLYKVLFPIRDQTYIKEFCHKIIDPLLEYGRKQNIDLLGTVEIYIKNDGDYKKTASELFTHENTIRFRITKAKSLLGLENSHFKFIEHMSVAIKATKLMGIQKT